MAREDIWVTREDEQKQKKSLIYISIAIVLVVILVFALRSGSDDVTGAAVSNDLLEQDANINEQVSYDTVQEQIEGVAKELNKCRIQIKFAEDEVLDAYSIQQKLQSRIEELEEELELSKKDLPSARKQLMAAEATLWQIKEDCSLLSD